MYQQDWIIRQIRSMGQAIARIVLGKDSVTYELTEETNSERADLLYKDILILLESGNINEAENLLFEKMEAGDIKYLNIALDFYNRLNELRDEDLEKGDFTREEIKMGLDDALKIYGINVSDVFSIDY